MLLSMGEVIIVVIIIIIIINECLMRNEYS